MFNICNRKRLPKAKDNHVDSEPYKRFKQSPIDEECSYDTAVGKDNNQNKGAARKIVSKYKEAYLDFINSKISQKSLTFLRRIVFSDKISSEIRGQPLFRLILDVYEKLLLSEIEITVWAIYLDRFVWSDKNLPLHLLLIISAFAAKSYLNNTEIFYDYIISKIHGFDDVYKQWATKNWYNFEVTGKELNMKYSSLNESILFCKEYKIVEYNYYVDEILQSSPPYRQDLKDLSSACEEEWDLLDLELNSSSTKASNSFSEGFNPEMDTINSYFGFINPFYNFGYASMMNSSIMFYPYHIFSYWLANSRGANVPKQIFRPVPVRYFSSEKSGEDLI